MKNNDLEVLYTNILLNESYFRKSKKVIHLIDVPMFSIFLDKNLDPEKIEELKSVNSLNSIKKSTEEARREIGKIGFPSKHANVFITTLNGDAAGLAHSNAGFMSVDVKYIGQDYFTNILTHEWAHLFMFHKSKQFKKAVEELYKKKMESLSNVDTKEHFSLHDTDLEDKIKFTRSPFYYDKIIKIISSSLDYEMSNSSIKQYISIHTLNRLTLDNIESYILHSMSFPVNLKNDTQLVDYSGRSIIVPKDTEVSVIFLTGGWSIDYYKGNQRYGYPDNIKMSELFHYIKSSKGEFLRIIKNGIKKWQEQHSVSLDDIREKLKGALGRTLKSIIDNLRSFVSAIMEKKGFKTSFSKVSMKEEIDEYVGLIVNDIIVPMLDESIKDGSILSIKHYYDFLWSSNEKFKSPGKSFADFFYPIALKIAESYSEKFNVPRELGIVDNPLKRIAKKMNIWHSAYGMSNEQELWATAIEDFFDMSMSDKRAIIQLMMRD